MTQRDYYQVLGVPRDAPAADIRAAYTRLARLHHPDAAGDAAVLPTRLHELQHAYHCLADAQTRAAHDRALNAAEHAHFERQRTVRRHLRRYDRHHPHEQPRDAALGWRGWLPVLAVGVALAAGAAFALFG